MESIKYILTLMAVLLISACGSSSSQTIPDMETSGETKGQRFSKCLDTATPEECDRRINR